MARQPKHASAEDVARLAGVSKMTVSRAFSQTGYVSAEKRGRVMTAAKQLGYRPNALARSLRTTRSRLVGLILEDFTNPHFLNTLETITRKLQENGLHAMAINAARGIDLAQAAELVMQFRIDGLIVSSETPLELEYECAAMGIPLVVFARTDSRIAGTYGVCVDDRLAGSLAAEHLVERGYRRPCFIGGSAGTDVSVQRRGGFEKRLNELGILPLAAGIAAGNTYEAGYEAGRRILSGNQRPDALFCESDQLAVGAMDAAQRLFGIRVPGDLGVVGVDNTWISGTAHYDLTTIAQPLDDMAQTTASILLAALSGPVLPNNPPLFEVRIIPRGSTARL